VEVRLIVALTCRRSRVAQAGRLRSKDNAENALAIIHSALEQEAENAAPNACAKRRKKFIGRFTGRLSRRALPRIMLRQSNLTRKTAGPGRLVLSRINGESDIE